MSKQNILEDYFEVTIARSNNWTCHKCTQPIKSGAAYLFMRRNRHIFNICGKCLVFFGRKAIEIQPDIVGECVDTLL